MTLSSHYSIECQHFPSCMQYRANKQLFYTPLNGRIVLCSSPAEPAPGYYVRGKDGPLCRLYARWAFWYRNNKPSEAWAQQTTTLLLYLRAHFATGVHTYIVHVLALLAGHAGQGTRQLRAKVHDITLPSNAMHGMLLQHCIAATHCVLGVCLINSIFV